MTGKSERDRQLHADRSAQLTKLYTLVNAACDSHSRRDIGKMKDTLQRMLGVIVALLDRGSNAEKRNAVTELIGNATVSSDAVIHSEDGKKLYYHGELDLDKLVEAIVWLKPDPEIELVEINK